MEGTEVVVGVIVVMLVEERGKRWLSLRLRRTGGLVMVGVTSTGPWVEALVRLRLLRAPGLIRDT